MSVLSLVVFSRFVFLTSLSTFFISLQDLCNISNEPFTMIPHSRIFDLWHQCVSETKEYPNILEVFVTCIWSPVLNIGRVDWDIGRYLLCCMLPIWFGKIVRYIVCNKNGRYLKYRPINCPRYRPIWNNLFIARLRANIHCFLLSLYAYYIIFIR